MSYNAGASLLLEEGQFTPYFTDNSLNGSEGQTHTLQYGFYTKIGSRVLYNLDLFMSAKGSLSGSVIIRGLPYRVNSPTTANGMFNPTGSVYSSAGLSIASGTSVSAYSSEGLVDYLTIVNSDDTDGFSILQWSEVGATLRLSVAGQYYTEDTTPAP